LFNVARLSVEEKGAFEQMMKERIQISKWVYRNALSTPPIIY
jgi:hypothetical protein